MAILGFIFQLNPLTISVLAICAAYLLHRYWKYSQRIAVLNKLPGPPPAWPIIGHLPLIMKPNMSTMEAFFRSAIELNKQYGRDGVWHLAVGPDHIVFVSKAKTVEKIFTDNTNIKKDNATYDLLAEWWGHGLISSWGDKWRVRRKMLTPAFHFNILQEFLPIMNDQSDILIQKIKEVEGKSTDVTNLITRTALDVIGETSMGIKLDSQSNTNSKYLESIKVMGDTVVTRSFGGLQHKLSLLFGFTDLGKKYRKALVHLVSLTQKVIRERKHYLAQEIASYGLEKVFSRKAMPLLDILLKYHFLDQTGKNMTLADVLEETEQFMFAGHDTTSYAISWTLYLLGHNPDHQARVQEELDQIFADDPTRHVTSSDLNEMTYLEMCLKESMRIYSTVPMVARELLTDVTLEGHYIPAGTSIYVMLYLMGQDEEFFPNWSHFDPERFSKESIAARNNFAFVPFSAGPRNCIGQKYALMEAKTVLAKVLRSFKVKSVKSRDDMRVEPSMILRPVGTIDLIFNERK